MLSSRFAQTCLVLGALACGASRPAPPGPEAVALDAMGRYGFVADVPGGQRLTGTLDVMTDTLLARVTNLECKVSPQQTNRDFLAYDCAVPGTPSVNLLIDRRNPTKKSTWAVVTQVSKKRDVCVAWRTWENGSRSCTLSQPEEYFERVRVQGALVVTR
jgi:hypothetical protein